MSEHVYMYEVAAVCCSVLQCVAVCCSVLQCVAYMYVYMSEHVYKCVCSILQYTYVLQCVAACDIYVLQCVAACCSVLQRVAVWCMQYTTIYVYTYIYGSHD